jgi:hypothetical protein
VESVWPDTGLTIMGPLSSGVTPMSLSLPMHPFQMLVDPQAVLDAMAASTHLESLQRRVFRPLATEGGVDDLEDGLVDEEREDPERMEGWER